MKGFCKYCGKKVDLMEVGFRKVFEEQRYKCSLCGEPCKPKKSNLFTYLLIGILSITLIFLINSVWAYTSTVTVSDTNLGQIRSDFYGSNIESFGSNLSWIDKNKDNTLESDSNYTWHREKMNLAGIKLRRTDANFNGIVQAEGQYNTTRTLNNNGNILQKRNLVEQAYIDGAKIILSANSMPNWLANNTEGWCNTNLFTCPPSNYTKWTRMLIDYINITTNDGLWSTALLIEVWNEPNQNSFFMYNVTDRTNSNISREYNKLCNATLQVKLVYPNVQVGCGSTTVTAGRDEIERGVLGNYSNMDFYTKHFYKLTSDSQPIQNYYQSEINSLNANLTLYNFNKYVIITEVGNQNASIMNATDQSEFKKDYSILYTLFLTQNNRNYSLLPYNWAGRSNYSNTRTETKRWEMIAEPDLDNKLYVNYNITKIFATNHRAGINYIYNTSSSNQSLKVVTSKDSSKTYITLTNTLNEGVNATIITSLSGKYLRDVETGQNYTSNNGVFTINGMGAYGVKTFSSESYNVSVDFSTSLGNVRSDFYGVNTHGKYLSNLSTDIDIDNNGVREGKSDQSWYRQKFEESGMNTVRIDGSINLWTNNTLTGSNFSMPSYLERNKQTVNYTRSLGGKVIIVMGYMPSWLANVTTDCDSDNSTCGANNWTRYGDLMMTALDYYTNNGEWNSSVEVESWNEPFDAFLLKDTGTTLVGNKSDMFIKIHNLTYDRVKAKYPSMKILANIVYLTYGTSNINHYRYDWVMANLTYKIEKISIHGYSDYELITNLQSKLPALYANCTLYGSSCADISITEWNIFNQTMKNSSSQYGNYSQRLADLYSHLLNNYPSNFSSIFYEFGSDYHYGTYYSNPWNMLSEPRMDNVERASFNITKMFTRYGASGSTIKNSTSLFNGIKIVASTTSSGADSIILTNTESNNKSIDIAINGGANSFIDVNTGKLYDSSDGIIENVTFNEYGVVFLTEPYFYPQEDGTTEIQNYLGEYLYSMSTPSELQGEGACISIIYQLGQYPVLVGLIGAVFLIGMVVVMIGGWMAFKPGEEVTQEGVITFFVLLMGIGFLVIIGIVILESLCSTGIY